MHDGKTLTTEAILLKVKRTFSLAAISSNFPSSLLLAKTANSKQAWPPEISKLYFVPENRMIPKSGAKYFGP